jgi:hypothetical protein
MAACIYNYTITHIAYTCIRAYKCTNTHKNHTISCIYVWVTPRWTTVPDIAVLWILYTLSTVPLRHRTVSWIIRHINGVGVLWNPHLFINIFTLDWCRSLLRWFLVPMPCNEVDNHSCKDISHQQRYRWNGSCYCNANWCWSRCADWAFLGWIGWAYTFCYQSSNIPSAVSCTTTIVGWYHCKVVLSTRK